MSNTILPLQLPEPPPAPEHYHLDLVDGTRVVGWITPDTIAFHGFADRVEAAHAAWAAYRTLSWRRAARRGGRPIPVSIEPLSIVPDGDELHAHASGRSFARLLEPSASQEGWAFVLTLPERMVDIFVTAKAYAIYRMLRRSGIRWSMWIPERRPDPAPAAQPEQAREERRSWWLLPAAAIGSLSLVVVALLASERLAIILAFLGLGGLFAARLAAMGQEWSWRLARESRMARQQDARS